jgi:hypothetical protein
MDDADKYDFADNYQQTEDDVNADEIDNDKQYVQEKAQRFFKDSDDVYEEDGQVQTDDSDDAKADDYN